MMTNTYVNIAKALNNMTQKAIKNIYLNTIHH